MQLVANASDVGTGHCAVGSIVGVASIIGANLVTFLFASYSANGGWGKAFDKLELNRVLCQHCNNVRIAGVVIKKVLPNNQQIRSNERIHGQNLRMHP